MMAEPTQTVNFLREIEDIPKKAIDPLSDTVLTRFNGAVAWQGGETVNGKSVRTVLRECWEQVNSVRSCDDQQRMEALGVNVTVNLTALKCGIAHAYLNDALVAGDSALPWVISPTPRPDLSAESKQELLRELKEVIFSGGAESGAMLVEIVRQGKKVLKRREDEKAEIAAREMTTLIEDQCAEGGFARSLTDFLHYFTIYPYAVFSGPYITRAPRLSWGNKKPRMATEVFPQFRAISPFDFAYSPDSPDTQRGTCVFTRTLWTRKQLLDAGKLTSYLTRNIAEVLAEADGSQDFNMNWLTREPDASGRDVALWQSNVKPLEVLTHYGIMSGRELQKYGLHGLDANDFYNCEIAMAAYRVIQVKVIGDTRLQTRPVYTASFYRTGGDRIAGDGIAQRIRDVERAYHSCLAYLMRNASNASAPMCEADYRRLSKYMNDSDLGTLVPGTMYLADGDMAGGNPALRFFNIPANMAAYTQLMEMFMQLADRVTNIPAALHGEAVGSGAMRTFRGMSMLQGNATRALDSSVDNISNGVFLPLGTLLYQYNMLYAEDVTVKGDSQIIAKGAKGILAKEMEKQDIMGILQMIGTVGQQLGSVMNLGPLIGWASMKMFSSYGVPDDILSSMSAGVPTIPPGAPGGAPNPAPSSPTGEGVAADVGGMAAGGGGV